MELRRALPGLGGARLLRISRWSTVALAVLLLLIASQGYSVLYLFLLADLVCAAAAFPVFYGLYSERCTGRAAVWSTLAGLLTGVCSSPTPP